MSHIRVDSNAKKNQLKLKLLGGSIIQKSPYSSRSWENNPQRELDAIRKQPESKPLCDCMRFSKGPDDIQ